jgi:hypothetical protein
MQEDIQMSMDDVVRDVCRDAALAVDIIKDINGMNDTMTVTDLHHASKYLFRTASLNLPLHEQLAHMAVDLYKRTQDDVLKTHLRRYIRAYMNGVLTSEVLEYMKNKLISLHSTIMMRWYADDRRGYLIYMTKLKNARI